MDHSFETAFASIIPLPVRFVCTAQFSERGPLSPGEEEYLSGATSQRRKDFATGRKCAVAALEALGVFVPSLDRAKDRQPDWPPGTIGSITHCEGLCAAAASHTKLSRFLGIDAEPNEPLPQGVLKRIASRKEVAQIQSTAKAPLPYRFSDRTLFSAKESVFKALYPVVGAYFGFEEVELRPDASAGRFRALLSDSIQVAAGIAFVEGRFANTADHTMTAVHVGM